MAKRYPKEIRDEVLGKIRGGQRVAAVAEAHGIREATIRSWLERDTVEGASQVLEISRLKRENEILLKIIGQMKADSEREKKKTRRGWR
jgi:transposase-like protein